MRVLPQNPYSPPPDDVQTEDSTNQLNMPLEDPKTYPTEAKDLFWYGKYRVLHGR